MPLPTVSFNMKQAAIAMLGQFQLKEKPKSKNGFATDDLFEGAMAHNSHKVPPGQDLAEGSSPSRVRRDCAKSLQSRQTWRGTLQAVETWREIGELYQHLGGDMDIAAISCYENGLKDSWSADNGDTVLCWIRLMQMGEDPASVLTPKVSA